MSDVIRFCGFCLHRHVHKETQDRSWGRTYAIAPHEDPGSRLDGLFLYHVNVQRRHVDVWGHGQGKSEELPSRVSCACFSTIK